MYEVDRTYNECPVPDGTFAQHSDWYLVATAWHALDVCMPLSMTKLLMV